MTQLTCRLTGPQSRERINPILLQFALDRNIRVEIAQDPICKIDFVWETYCEKNWREAHNHAKVLNRLSNSQVCPNILLFKPQVCQIFEDKSNFALLQLRMSAPHLETFVAESKDSLFRWLDAKWSSPLDTKNEVSLDHVSFEIDLHQLGQVSFEGEQHVWSVPPSSDVCIDWWAVKASKGNGGKDVWIVHKNNYRHVIAEALRGDEEFVVQRYSPLSLPLCVTVIHPNSDT
jgi:hypothetical protein